jgi:hypothetical protein
MVGVLTANEIFENNLQTTFDILLFSPSFDLPLLLDFPSVAFSLDFFELPAVLSPPPFDVSTLKNRLIS